MKRCGSSILFQSDTGLKSFVQNIRQNAPKVSSLGVKTVRIPIVFHVVGNTTVQNYVTDTRIANQISQLNLDYSGTNTDITKVPTVFQGYKAGDTGIEFFTQQIIRRTTSISLYAGGDVGPCQETMKYYSLGGSNVVNPDSCLYVWI